MVLLIRRYPLLARWTGGWSGLWKKGGFASGNLGADTPRQSFSKAGPAAKQGKATGQEAPPSDESDYVSACSQVPLPLHWRNVTLLVVCLSLVLTADLLLIRLRPELMQMGARFLRIGALVFGSGYAMLPFIQDAVVNQFAWLTNRQFAVALALSLITPGPVTIIGTFIGYKVAGVAGALAGTVNMYFPAWAMTTIVAAPYAKAGQAGYVKQVIGGVVAAFLGTLVVVLIQLGVDTLVDISAITMATAAFAVQRFVKIDTIWIVLGGALVSLVLFR
jgi:chromate transporter